MRWMRKWPDLSLRAKCLLLISFPAAATVLMFGVANILAARNSAAVELVNRALEIAEEIQRLRAAEIETSADVRAYFITAQEVFASRTRSSLAAVDSAREKLLNLTANSALQQQRLLEIASIQHARVERMFGATAQFREGALQQDQLRAEVSEVENERSQMEDLLELMEQDNARQVKTFFGGVAALRAQQSVFTGICLLFGLAGGAAMTLLFARGITSRIGRLQRNVAHLASGGRPEQVAGRDEIGALNEGLIRVAEVLRRKGVALENVPHGIAEVDAEGRYLWLNKSYSGMAGCSHIYRATIAATVQPDDRPRVQEAITQMRLNGRAEIAAHIDQPHGQAPDVGFTFLAVSEDPGSNFYVFLRDIWAGKRGDAALIRAKDAAVASNRAKTEFLAKISHDIRTPLNAILGSADLLSQTPLSVDQGDYVSMFQRNCRRLVALINDFLDFSRIEAGAVRVEMVPYRIRATMDESVATFRESAARKGITLGVEIDPVAPEWALGDPMRIQQVLVNLLSNALKFTAAGHVDVNVKVMRAASSGDKLRFEVCDNGPGIALEDQDKIFARFVQLPNQTTGQRGTGLGLTICRDLVELMGGEIGVVSREGRGSTFHFSLPLQAVEPALADPAAAVTGPAQLPSNETIRIMVAEDTEDNRLLLEHYLRDQPVTLRFAQNGREALDAIEQGEQFDLILMDIDMPVMDGYVATQRIRAWQQSNGIPTTIVALSADAMQEAVRASMDAGCAAHVAKPVDRETLLKTIRRYAPAPAKGVQVAQGPQAAQVGQGVPAARSIPISEQIMALVPQYLASKEKQIEEARASLASGDFAPIRRFGHNLKGTGRGYGFPPMEEMGREIERASMQEDASRVADQLDALHRFVSESAAALTHA